MTSTFINKADTAGLTKDIEAPPSRLILSTSHPTADWLTANGSYFDAHHVEETWSDGMIHRYWRQRLQRSIEEFTAAGFVIERLIEHQPDPQMAHEHASEYAKLSREPAFIAFQLAKTAMPAPLPTTDRGTRESAMTSIPGSPTLIVVSGGPGTGKTTLAHELARELGCPAIIRDEIKQGMVMSTPGYQSGGDDPLNYPTMGAFFGILNVLLKAGVTVLAEAAFQDRLWRPNLEPLAGLGQIYVIRCTTPAAIAHARIVQRAQESVHRTAHADRDLLDAIAAGGHSLESFVPISLDVPTLTVDTSNGYDPQLGDIASFIRTTVTPAQPAGEAG